MIDPDNLPQGCELLDTADDIVLSKCREACYGSLSLTIGMWEQLVGSQAALSMLSNALGLIAGHMGADHSHTMAEAQIANFKEGVEASKISQTVH